jgi:hypothetical protein
LFFASLTPAPDPGMWQYRRKLILLLILAAVYAGVGYWVPYSKLWLMQDLMQTQSRLFFATQSTDRIKDYLVRKAEDLNIPLQPGNAQVQNINGEILYIKLIWDASVDILFYHSTLHFEPEIYGLIRGFGQEEKGVSTADQLESSIHLSDSTANFLRHKNLLDSQVREYFSRP